MVSVFICFPRGFCFHVFSLYFACGSHVFTFVSHVLFVYYHMIDGEGGGLAKSEDHDWKHTRSTNTLHT